MTALIERRAPVTDNAVTAAFVLGLEARQGTLTVSDYQVAVQRLERAVRPWDSVVDVAPRCVGVLCTSLVSESLVESVAARLAEVVRAPMAVGDEVHVVGARVGWATVRPGEDASVAFARARAALKAAKHSVVPSPR